MEKKEIVELLEKMAESPAMRETLTLENIIAILKNEKCYEELKSIWLKKGK